MSNPFATPDTASAPDSDAGRVAVARFTLRFLILFEVVYAFFHVYDLLAARRRANAVFARRSSIDYWTLMARADGARVVIHVAAAIAIFAAAERLARLLARDDDGSGRPFADMRFYTRLTGFGIAIETPHWVIGALERTANSSDGAMLAAAFAEWAAWTKFAAMAFIAFMLLVNSGSMTALFARGLRATAPPAE